MRLFCIFSIILAPGLVDASLSNPNLAPSSKLENEGLDDLKLFPRTPFDPTSMRGNPSASPPSSSHGNAPASKSPRRTGRTAFQPDQNTSSKLSSSDGERTLSPPRAAAQLSVPPIAGGEISGQPTHAKQRSKAGLRQTSNRIPADSRSPSPSAFRPKKGGRRIIETSDPETADKRRRAREATARHRARRKAGETVEIVAKESTNTRGRPIAVRPDETHGDADRRRRNREAVARHRSRKSVENEPGNASQPSQAVQPPVGQSQASQSQAFQPETGRPQTVQPQVGQSQAVQPQVSQPQASQPEARQPQAVRPQPVRLQAVQPQIGQAQASPSHAFQPQAIRPQVGQAQGSQPQAFQLQAARPQLFQPQVGQPQAFQVRPALGIPLGLTEPPAVGIPAESTGPSPAPGARPFNGLPPRQYYGQMPGMGQFPRGGQAP